MQQAINWNADIPIPTDSDYINRIKEATYGLSKSSGNPMITLKLEVVSPEQKEIGGKLVNIAGITTTNYFTTTILGEDKQIDIEETKEARRKVFGTSGDPENPSLYERLGLDGSKENPENPNMKALLGICVFTQMFSESDEQRKTPTADELAKAKKNNVHPSKAGAIMK